MERQGLWMRWLRAPVALTIVLGAGCSGHPPPSADPGPAGNEESCKLSSAERDGLAQWIDFAEFEEGDTFLVEGVFWDAYHGSGFVAGRGIPLPLDFDYKLTAFCIRFADSCHEEWPLRAVTSKGSRMTAMAVYKGPGGDYDDRGKNRCVLGTIKVVKIARLR